MRGLFILLCLLQSLIAHCRQYYLIAGTYTSKGSKGIYVYRFDDSTGRLQWVSNTNDRITNPSYLTISPDGRFVYSCTDTRSSNEGSVSAFSFDRKNGTLKFINKQPSGGANPVYVAINNTGKWLVNGNYTGGSLSLFPINNDGSLQPYSQLIQHEGNSIDTERQEKAHVHATVFSPQQDYLFVPDLGADKIMAYRFTPQALKPLQPAGTPFVITTPGSGPRHFTFHPNGHYAYCIEELSGTITAYRYHEGILDCLQRIGSYKKREEEYNSADIHISSDGKFLYASNRNLENNISIFTIEEATGKLSLRGHINTGGKEPRNFIITPSGNFLLVVNQVSGTIIVFSRDSTTGLLQQTKNKVKLTEPSCLQLSPIE